MIRPPPRSPPFPYPTLFLSSQTAPPFNYTFNASTTAPTTSRTVNSTNGAASNSANASYSINADTTGPSVPAPTVTAGYYTSLSVPVSLGSVTDTGGSGPQIGRASCRGRV